MVAYLLYSIKAINVEMLVINSHFINDREVIAIYFEAAASYLKKCLTKGRTSYMNISTVDT